MEGSLEGSHGDRVRLEDGRGHRGGLHHYPGLNWLRSSPWKWCNRLRGCRGLVPVRSAGSASPPCSSRSLAPWSGAHGTGRAVPGRDTGGLRPIHLSARPARPRPGAPRHPGSGRSPPSPCGAGSPGSAARRGCSTRSGTTRPSGTR
ncbi:hypothetical protein MBAV_002414 [Candidatus Magnetobacterium bavaricum]|uniref:Uncharacterized protein n=1 Tax=Candidatus Magnetobacterium bavaricum TaxID=29290 RepID=A0A0F3GXI3_9BACT|nr:hypothetical protein MBAV_002414 [Candidatus Magnetobacterium bavaricum]